MPHRDPTSNRNGPIVLVLRGGNGRRQPLERDLEQDGLRTVHCPDESRIAAMAELYRPQLLVLDLELGNCSVRAIYDELRTRGIGSPILVLAEPGQDPEDFRSLDGGTVDCLPRPFTSADLAARIRTHLTTTPTRTRAGSFKDLRLDAAVVVKDTRRIRLTPTELQLLRVLVGARGSAVSRRELLDLVWGDVFVTERTIDTHIATLRQKLGRGPLGESYIATVRGVGYRMNERA